MFGKGPTGAQRFGKNEGTIGGEKAPAPKFGGAKPKKRRFSMHRAVPGAGLAKFGGSSPSAMGQGEPDEDDQY